MVVENDEVGSFADGIGDAFEERELLILLCAFIGRSKLGVIKIGVEDQQAEAVKAAGIEAGALGDAFDVAKATSGQVVVAQAPMGAGLADEEDAIQIVQGAAAFTTAGTEVAAQPNLIKSLEIHSSKAMIHFIVIFSSPLVGMADEAVRFRGRGRMAGDVQQEQAQEQGESTAAKHLQFF